MKSCIPILAGVLLAAPAARAQTATLRVETNAIVAAGPNAHFGHLDLGSVVPQGVLIIVGSRFTSDQIPPNQLWADTGLMDGNLEGFVNYVSGAYFLHPRADPWTESVPAIARYYSYDYEDARVERIVHEEPLATEDSHGGTFHFGQIANIPLVVNSLFLAVDNELFFDDEQGVGRLRGTDGGTGVVNYVTGDWLVAPANYNLASSIRASYAVSKEAWDPYEPDNAMADAQAIANGQVQNRNIHAPANADWATFTIGGTGARNLVVETAGAGGDTLLDLYRADGSLVAGDNDSGTNLFSRITVAYLPAGTYFVRVRENGDNATIPAYTLTANWTTEYAPDAYEADDTVAAARAIGNGETQIRNIHAAGNEDWATLVVGGAGARNLQLDTSGTEGDTQLGLYGRDNPGVLLAFDDDSGAGSFSRITVAELAPGTYYLRVLEKDNDGTIPAYALTASWTPVAAIRPDAYERDDTASRARTLRNGRTQFRNIHAKGNPDWAKFKIGSRGARKLRLQTIGTGGDTRMWLYRGGRLVAYDNDSGVGRFSFIWVSRLAAGTYYVKIRENGDNETIPAYKLRATWVSP